MTSPAAPVTGHYKYVFGEARSGRIIAEIPMYGVSMNVQLNGAYDFQGAVQADMTGISNRTLASATEPGRTFVVVERNGVPVWDGHVTARTYQASSKNYQVFARSLTGYPYRVKINTDYYPNGLSVSGQEQTSLFLSLWSTLQSRPDSDIRVVLPSPLSTGVLRSLDVQEYEDKYFGDVMDEVANGNDGFDWRIVTSKVAGEYVRNMQIGYPTIGTADNNALVFEYPGPVMQYWRTDSVGNAGTHIHGLGSGQGEDMLRSKVVHQNLLDAGYLRWDYDVQFKEVTNQGNLDGLTNDAAQRIARPPNRRYTIELHGSSQPEFGTYLVGDSCTLRFEDAAHPGGYERQARIVGWRLTPPSGAEVEKVGVYFEEGGVGA